MDLNRQFGELFDKILSSNKHRIKLFKLISKLNKEDILNNNLTLLLIKSFILIFSENPEKIKICIKLLKELNNCDIELKMDIKNFIIKLHSKNNLIINDDKIEKIIFKTFKTLEKIYNICPNQVYLIWNQIIFSINKLKKIKNQLKIDIYLKLLDESNLILDKHDSKSFLKILDLCVNLNKIINEYTK